MEDTIERILSYVILIDSELEGLGEEDFLGFVISEVLDRTLLYMNRSQLVAQYEEDLLDTTVDEEDYVLPIPTELERPLARIVVGNYKTILENVDVDATAIKSIKDNGQEITYGDGVVSYLSSKEDADIFSSITKLLDKFRIPNIVENT